MLSLSFFNKRNSFAATMRFYNAVVFVYAAYDWYTNLDATWDEQGLEMAVAAINMMALREGVVFTEAMGIAALNLVDLGALLRGLSSEWSSVHPVINLVAATGHLLSPLAAAVAACEKESENSSTSKKSSP